MGQTSAIGKVDSVSLRLPGSCSCWESLHRLSSTYMLYACLCCKASQISKNHCYSLDKNKSLCYTDKHDSCKLKSWWTALSLRRKPSGASSHGTPTTTIKDFSLLITWICRWLDFKLWMIFWTLPRLVSSKNDFTEIIDKSGLFYAQNRFKNSSIWQILECWYLPLVLFNVLQRGRAVAVCVTRFLKVFNWWHCWFKEENETVWKRWVSSNNYYLSHIKQGDRFNEYGTNVVL